MHASCMCICILFPFLSFCSPPLFPAAILLLLLLLLPSASSSSWIAMFIATAASLYSTSPPPPPPPHAFSSSPASSSSSSSPPPPSSSSSSPLSSSPSSPSSSSPSPTSSVLHSFDFHARSSPITRPIVGGLSSILNRHPPPSSSSDASCVVVTDCPVSSCPRRSSLYADIASLTVDRHKSSTSPVTEAPHPDAHFSSSRKLHRDNTSRTSPNCRISLTNPSRQEPAEVEEAEECEEEGRRFGGNDGEGEFSNFYYMNNEEVETPRLFRTSCSSLSEFFCKPLFPEAFLHHGDDYGNELLKMAQQENAIFKDSLIVEAFNEAWRAHNGQFRENGDAFVVHCLETAKILAAIGASKVVIAAGLLHDTIDESSIKFTQLESQFGSEVATLVNGVTRLSEFSKLARDSNTAYKSVEADRLHTMMLAMVDVRVVLIKLADRLHNMRTLGALQKYKRDRIAKETLEVFVPLARRLGIWSWKAEIEDLCFKHLDYHTYRNLSNKLAQECRESIILSAIETLDKALLANGVEYLDLCGRPKNLYSIHNKMIRKGRKIEEIYDAQGLRIIVPTVADCYAALDVVHGTWPCISGKQKDYISEPKPNGYKSLHTVVWGKDGRPLEIQIRTMEMHHQAEFGVAAHWRYKEGDVPYSSFVLEMVEWARFVLSWQNEIMDTKLRLSRGEVDVRHPCVFPFHDEACPYRDLSYDLPYKEDHPLFVIVVEKDKMKVQEVPQNSTIANLLEDIHNEDPFPIASDESFLDDRAAFKVNHKEVDNIHQKLEMGDLIELVPRKSVDDYREKLMRIYDACSMQDTHKSRLKSTAQLSGIAVF